MGNGYEHVSSAQEAEFNDAEIGPMPCIFDFNLVEAINVALLECIHSQLRFHLHPLGKLCILKIYVALVYDFYSVRIGFDAVLVNRERGLSFCFVLWQSSHFLLKPYLLVSLLLLCLLKPHLLISLLLNLLLLELELFPLQLQFLLLQSLPVEKLVILLPFKTHLLAHHLLLDVSIIRGYFILPWLLGLRIVLRSLALLNGRQLYKAAIIVVLVRDISDNDLLIDAAGTHAAGRTDYHRPAASQHASRSANAHSATHHAVAHAVTAHSHSHHASVHHPHPHVHLHSSHSHVHGTHPYHFGSQKRTSHGHVHCSNAHIHCSDSHVHRAHVHHPSSEGHVHSKHSILLMRNVNIGIHCMNEHGLAQTHQSYK